MKKLIIHTDGASRGNPGPASIAFTIKDERGKRISQDSRTIGVTTNNQAEYQAIIAALEEARKLGAEQVIVESDSELVVKQITGEYRVKKASLRPLYQQVGRIASQFNHFSIRHIPRDKNTEADRLANRAFRKPSSTD
jgi:ribonuclease HI